MDFIWVFTCLVDSKFLSKRNNLVLIAILLTGSFLAQLGPMISFTIRIKIIFIITLACVLLFFTSSYVSRVLSHNTDVVIEIERVNYPSLNLTALNKTLLKEAYERFNTAVMLGDIDTLDANQSVAKQINDNLSLIAGFHPLQKEALDTLEDKVNLYFNNAFSLASGIIDGTADLSKAASLAEVNRQLYEEIDALLNSNHEKDKQLFEKQVSELIKQNKQTESFIIAMCLFSLVSLITVAWVVARGIRRDLMMVTGKIKDVIAAGNTDLTVRLEYEKKDELKPLVDNFNLFVEMQHNNILKIANDSTSLTDISNGLSTANTEAHRVSNEQLIAVDSVANSIIQLSQVAQDISSNALDTAKAVTTTLELSQRGGDFVQDTMQSLNVLVEDIKKGAEVVAELNASTKNAESILNTINTIADQTNLLALNAAIEAARAGEQGRGFAVVADEVRTLASRTQTSTHEIQQVLEQLQTKANTTMNFIENSVKSAEVCTAKSIDAEVTLKNIIANVSDVEAQNALIAKATEQQGNTTQDIESNLLQIRDMSQQTVNSLLQVDQMTQEIKTVKEDLVMVTDQFRLQ